jgi:hypothetical protein
MSRNTTVGGHLNFDDGLISSDLTRIYAPKGGAYTTSTPSVTGAIKIKLPTARLNSSTMMRMTVKIYEYNTGQSHTFEIGGYNYSSGNWYNIFAHNTTDSGPNYTVRFGQDGTSDCIWIGELGDTWAYPQVFVTEFQAGYSGLSTDWSTGWAVSFVTSFDTVEQTRTSSYILNQNNSPYAYNMNQYVRTTDSPTFADLTLTGGDLNFTNGTRNRINFASNGVAAPTFGSTSNGAKIVLYPEVGASSVDYSIGIEGNTMWFSVPVAGAARFFKWYGGTTNIATLASDGEMTLSGVLNATAVNTGQGDTEVYLMNQNVRTTDAVTFATINTGQGATEVHLMNQNLRTTDNVTFNQVTANIVGSVSGDAGTLLREDNRIISPSELSAGRLKFGFTSWANNNSSPYADFLHLRSYTDSSGGSDNLVMFKKSGIGMRIWQQTWGSSTAYSSYADVLDSTNNPYAYNMNQYVRTTDSPTFAGLNLGNGNLNEVQNIYLDDAIYSVGDTNTYMQFHAADQWRVVTGGAERLEVNNSQVTVAGTFQANVARATNFYDGTGTYNVNLGSGNSEGRGLVAGYSGGQYGGIGYNVRHTTSSGVYIAPLTDTATYLVFNQGFTFLNDQGTTPGRTASFTQIGRLDSGGNFTIPGDLTSARVNTGQGLTEVHLMNQNVRSTDSVSFNRVTLPSTSSRDKLRVYGSSAYAIGMQSGITFGALNDWAMTFQFNNEDDRGFWWGDEGHSTAQGAMSLTTNGKLTVARGIRVGYGESDTTILSDSLALDVNGAVNISGGIYTGEFKTFTWGGLSASATQARTFEIARIGRDFNDWNTNGTFEVEVHERYYSRGLVKKYQVYWGYSNNYGIHLTEIRGNGDNNFQVRVGAPVVVSGDHRYVSVYVDVRYYTSVDVKVNTNQTITTNTNSAIGQTYINSSPSATNISDFTADSTAYPTSNGYNVAAPSFTATSNNIGPYRLFTYGGTYTGDWQTLTNQEGEINYVQVNNISSGHSNQPSGVYTYGGVISARGTNHSFQLYAAHTGDLAYKTQWNNDNYSGWRRILDSTTYPYAANMNQFVRTTDNVSFNYVNGARVYVGGIDGTSYFFEDSNNRIATDADFYIRGGSGNTYLYSTNTYLGASSGDNIYVRGNAISGNNWSISAGSGTFTSTSGTAVVMDGAAGAQGIEMRPDSSGTYPVFLRSRNPSSGGEASAWIFKEEATQWGIWHNNPINALDFTRSATTGIAQNVGGQTNTVMIRMDMANGDIQLARNIVNRIGTTILDQSGNTPGTAGSVAWANVLTGTRTNYNLDFKPPTNEYAGFRFTRSTSSNGAGDAGYLLVRGTSDTDIYTAEGITLVADAGWLTLAQRTTASRGIRLMTGTTSTTRMYITTAGITYFDNAESINLYGIRGRFTNEYIHLYNKVGIGHPSGWGQGQGDTPNQGLSTYGGVNFGYGSLTNHYIRGPLHVIAGAANGASDGSVYIEATNNNDWGLIVNKYNSSASEYGVDVRVGSGATFGMRLTGNGAERWRVRGDGNMIITNTSPTITFRDTDHNTAFIHVNSNIFYILRGSNNVDHGNWATVNSYWPLEINLTNNNATFGGNVYIGADARYFGMNSTANWGGNTGNGWGKLEYHSNRWYINAGANSTELVRFRRGGSDLARIDNSGYIYSPRFVDWDDNSYYGDFASESRFNTFTTAGRIVIGGTFGNNAYSSVSSTRLHFGGGDGDANGNYYIGTNLENFGGNYTKLDLRWHTGIRMGAQPSYGGIRFYDSEDLGTVIFSIGTSDANVRVTNNLFVGGQKAINSRNHHVGTFTNLATGEDWTVSGTGNGAAALGGGFSNNGSTSENSIIQDFDPWGRPAIVWRALNNDGGSNDDGGWNKNVSNLDGNKNYMFVVYVKRDSASSNGTYYFGCSSGETLNMNGTANGNPYFHAFGISSLPQGVWCLAVGYVFANNHGSTSSTGRGGVWRLDNGQKITGSTDYKMRYTGTRGQTHRTYLYYSTDASAQLKWWAPGVYEINGNEPNIGQLSGGVVSEAGQSLSGDLIFNSAAQIQMPFYNGGTMRFRTNTHWDSVSGIDSIGAAGEFRFSSDTGNLNIRTDGWLIAHDYVQAPIFYDITDSTYQLDLNSTSQSALRIRGGTLHGPNPTWGKYLLVGGNGREGYIDNGDVASVSTTNGNLHVDAASGTELYLNYYDGNSIRFGNGANGVTGRWNSSGNLYVGVDGNASYRLHVAGDVYANGGWLRVSGNQGVYWESHDTRFFSDDSNYIKMRSNYGLVVYDRNANLRGYLYHDQGDSFGLLDRDGNWAVRVVRDAYVEFRDNDEVMFRTGVGGVDGDYGSVQTHGGGKNGWEGYSINGRYVFMSADNDRVGIYNDIDNEWMTQWYRNGRTALYFNGSENASIETYGIYSNNQVRAAIYYDHDTNYYFDGNSTTKMNDSITVGTGYMGGATTNGYHRAYGTYSTYLGRIYAISFDWNANYDTAENHGIMSTNSGAGNADSISINSFNDITLRVDANNNNAESYVRFMDNTTASNQFAYIGAESGNYIAYFSNRVYGAIYYDIDSNYYFDGNGTSQLNRLAVNDYMFHRGDTDTYIGFDTNDKFRVVTGGAERFYITTGEVRSNLVFRCTNDVIAFYSDERLKTKEGLIDNALQKLLAIDGFYYRTNNIAKQAGFTEEGRQVGISAQQIQSILPEVVTLAPFDSEYDENGNLYSKSGNNYLTVKYDKLVPLIIEGVKDQHKIVSWNNSEIKKQKEIIASQQEQIDNLQNQVEELKEMIKSLMK